MFSWLKSLFKRKPKPYKLYLTEAQRKKIHDWMVENGANITSYPKSKDDVFVYEKIDVTSNIVKRTPNDVKIGSILQLDYGPKIEVYRHLEGQDGLHYWYCKYMPNNGQDAEANY